MDKITSKLRLPTPKKGKESERGALLDFFLSVLNPGRARANFSPLTHSRLSKILEGLEKKDLYYMQSHMKDLIRTKGATAASKWFYVALKNPEELKQFVENQSKK